MRKYVIPILMAALLLLNGCSSSQSANGVKTKVGTWKTAQTIQPFFYDKYLPKGHQAEILPFTNPGDMKTALLAGSLNLTGSTVVTAITAAAKGEPVVIVSSLCSKASALVVRKDSGIHSVSDLKGKKIAYVPLTMHHILLLETLKRAGLDPQKDVELKRIDFFDMGQALSQGTVDAFCSGEPYPSDAVTKGFGKVLEYPYYDDTVGKINAVMITTKDQIKKNRTAIQQLVTAQAKATEALKADPKSWLDKAAEFGTDRTVLEAASKNIDLTWNIDKTYIAQARNLAERMKDLGIISQVPDMNQLFDASFVGQASKELKQ